MGRPRKYEVVDESKLPHMTCQNCNCSYPETHFTKTKSKDENGENIRRKTCKTCIYKPKGRDKQKMHLNAIRYRCKQKGIPFNLTYEDLNIPDVCPILGISLMDWGEADGAGEYNSASVDKIIPSLGYIKGNVKIISNRANLMKSDATIENVRALLKYMEENVKC